MGSSSFCIPILDELTYSQHKIVAVYTQPPGRQDVEKVVEVPVASLQDKSY